MYLVDSPIIANEDRDTQKRKLPTNSLAADDGTPNKVFVCEKQSICEAQSNFGGTSTVSSAATKNGDKQKESFKDSPTNVLSSIGSSSAVGMTITPCAASSASDRQENIESSESAVTISKNMSIKGNTSDCTLTKEGKLSEGI